MAKRVHDLACVGQNGVDRRTHWPSLALHHMFKEANNPLEPYHNGAKFPETIGMPSMQRRDSRPACQHSLTTTFTSEYAG